MDRNVLFGDQEYTLHLRDAMVLFFEGTYTVVSEIINFKFNLF